MIGLALLLGGCASVPVGIKVATLVGSGVSYVATGKSLGDHALSAASGQDCALLRPLDGEPLCSEAHAGVPSAGDAGAPAGAPDRPAAIPPAALAAVPVTAPRRPSPPPAYPERYLVAGSFLSADNAARHCEALQELHPALLTQVSGGRRWHRVVIGPLGDATLRYRRQQLAELRQPGVWTLTIDTRTVVAHACGTALQLAGG